MKYYRLLAFNALLITLIALSSCEDYLNMPNEASTTQEEIFSTYESFQGFQDQLYLNLVDYHNTGMVATSNLGGESMSTNGNMTCSVGNSGNYRHLYLNNSRSSFWGWPNPEGFKIKGTWPQAWSSIRIANICLEKIEEGFLVDATDEQRNWLLGQAYFFRAYWHYEVVRSWGTIPYIDKVMGASDQDMQRHWSYEKGGKTYKDVQAVLERVAEDFELAAQYLPADWPLSNKNYGRATKIAAKGFLSKALLFSASPLFNEQANGILDYDNDLLLRSAKAAQETIELVKSNMSVPAGMVALNFDGLTPIENYIDMFATTVAKEPTTSEVLFAKAAEGFAQSQLKGVIGRHYGINNLHTKVGSNPTQMYVDKYELKSGERYDPDVHDNDANVRFNKANRDARYDKTFFVHNEKLGKVTTNFSEFGDNFKSTGMQNAYCIRKYFPVGVDKTNKDWNNFGFSTPLLRLADIYLGYAEAIYEATGSYNSIPDGFIMSAEQAVNIVRDRAGQPNVAITLSYYDYTQPNSCELSSDEPFRKLYRNERAVELGYEGVYWHDIRRWKRAQLRNGSNLYGLYFKTISNKDLNVDEFSLRRDVLSSFTFLERQYWLPFNPSLTQFSTEWEQNPGW
jgi:starch-binding outer membrane protein, SusD/RagB family